MQNNDNTVITNTMDIIKQAEIELQKCVEKNKALVDAVLAYTQWYNDGMERAKTQYARMIDILQKHGLKVTHIGPLLVSSVYGREDAYNTHDRCLYFEIKCTNKKVVPKYTTKAYIYDEPLRSINRREALKEALDNDVIITACSSFVYNVVTVRVDLVNKHEQQNEQATVAL